MFKGPLALTTDSLKYINIDCSGDLVYKSIISVVTVIPIFNICLIYYMCERTIGLFYAPSF